jgi:3-methyladenine DNA glycosylase AlkD
MTTDTQVREILTTLEGLGTLRDRDNLARFGITAGKAFGVSMANLQKLARQLGRDHDLASSLWDTGWYEARMLASLVDEPEQVTPAQMDRWCRDFDNWGICDTVCFCLFDRSPHAWRKVTKWAVLRDEYGKRAAFALLASLALHDKDASDEPFIDGLHSIEVAASDDRNFVKKGVSWALRSIGRRNARLHTQAVAVAERLAASAAPASRWIGKGAVKELTSPAVRAKVAAGRSKPAPAAKRRVTTKKPRARTKPVRNATRASARSAR